LAYSFAGFFVKGDLKVPASLPRKAVWRIITVPFAGVGLRTPNLIRGELHARYIRKLALDYGIDGARDWLFIRYVCWGGHVDSVYGLGRCNSLDFGPTQEDDLSRVQDAYLELMAAFGVRPDDALSFAPFVRGYWGAA
jgi:hypothetical protein